jgi:hypothetical protein
MPVSARAIRLLKEVRASTLCAFHRWGLGSSLAPRITVLMYHRVTDTVRDNLTVGIEQFERQMALLARFCDVMTIEQVLSTTAVPRSKRPLVAVTFDDGYLDNYLHAAPILRRPRHPRSPSLLPPGSSSPTSNSHTTSGAETR